MGRERSKRTRYVQTSQATRGVSGPALADVGGAWETRHMSSSARDARRLTPVEDTGSEVGTDTDTALELSA